MDFLQKHFDTILTVSITILGFIITYFMTKRNFKDEIRKEKINMATQTIYALPFDICELMDKLIKNKLCNPREFVEQYGALLSKVLSYGSKETIKIAVKMQQLSYEAANKPAEDKYVILAAYALLITQLKYDLTSEVISPESYFMLRMKDYENIKDSLKKAINSLVDELNLNRKFIV